MDQSFPKKEHLKSAERISQIYRQGKKVKQSFLLLYYMESGEESNHLALAVPKRRVALAVNRNRIKRKLKEVYRLNKTLLKAEEGYDFILMYLGSEAPEYQKLERAFLKLCEKWQNSRAV